VSDVLGCLEVGSDQVRSGERDRGSGGQRNWGEFREIYDGDRIRGMFWSEKRGGGGGRNIEKSERRKAKGEKRNAKRGK
jgi:hypothetical protein